MALYFKDDIPKMPARDKIPHLSGYHPPVQSNGIPKDAFKFTQKTPSGLVGFGTTPASRDVYAWEEGGRWKNRIPLPGGGSYSVPTGPNWNPFTASLPWEVKTNIGSDAQRQGAYLSGITQNAPTFNWIGNYRTNSFGNQGRGVGGSYALNPAKYYRSGY